MDLNSLELTSIISAGFLLGLTSGLHCLGMCGPLAYSTRSFNYHLGRLTGYLALLLPLSLMGQGLRALSPYMALAAGVFLGIVLIAQGLKSSGIISKIQWTHQHKITNALGAVFRKLSQGAGPWRLGVASAFLPCGVLWSAMAGALALSNWQGTLLAFTSFWAGTLPALVVGMPLAQYLGKKLSAFAPRAYGLGLCLIGLALITHRVSAAWMSHGAPSCH